MKIIINNNICQLVVGGLDFLVDPNILSNIRTYLSIPVPGAWHSEQFQKHVWDGKKYYLTPKGKLPTGMLPVLLYFLEDEYEEMEVELIDKRTGKVTFLDVWFTDVGDLSMEGDYDHQLRLAQAYDNYITFRDQKIYFPRGITDAATNAGKTTIIAGIYTNAIADVKNMLILIHRKVIYKQLVDFMGEVFGEVGQINDKYYEIKPVTVAMVQSLDNRVKDGVKARNDIASFSILVVDESHRAGAKTYKNVLKHSNAYCRVFLSGTALDSADDISKLDAISVSGPKLSEVKKVELMQKGISTPVEVRVHLCNTLLYKPIVDYRNWLDECVKYSSERVVIMQKIINASEGPVLVAVDKIEHGQYIFDRLAEMGTDRWVGFTHGQDPHQLSKVDAFKAGEIEVLISTAVLSEGINLPLVQELIYAAGGKAKISVKQWMGRIERLHHTKSKSVFHDFWDVGKYIQKHSEIRMKIYRDEQLPVLLDFDMKSAKKLKSVVI